MQAFNGYRGVLFGIGVAWVVIEWECFLGRRQEYFRNVSSRMIETGFQYDMGYVKAQRALNSIEAEERDVHEHSDLFFCRESKSDALRAIDSVRKDILKHSSD
jgi:hypothetical protein